MKALRQSIDADSHVFEDKDLALMRAVHATDACMLPFKHLLLRINATHRKGFREEEGKA